MLRVRSSLSDLLENRLFVSPWARHHRRTRAHMKHIKQTRENLRNGRPIQRARVCVRVSWKCATN